MARTYICGFELGALGTECTEATGWNISANRPVVDSTARTGTYSAKFDPPSATQHYFILRNTTAWSGYIRMYVRVATLPGSTRVFAGDTASGINLRLTSAGAIAIYNGGSLLGTSTTLLTDTARWYRVEVRCANGTSVPILLIDGGTEVTGTPSSWTMKAWLGASDTVATTYSLRIDDLSVDDAEFPGEGKVVMLRPTSLNAGGSWREGDGSGTANMSAAVSTKPPPGNSVETASTNIESAASSTTDNCDMNMTTYLAAGITAGDTVKGTQAVVRHGEDIVTGTKGGAVKIVSNPAQSGENTFNYGNDAGAHGVDNDPSSNVWYTTYGTVQTAAVNVNVAPVMRVGKRTATTRIVCVDAMGIYVDYTPADMLGMRLIMPPMLPPYRRV